MGTFLHIMVPKLKAIYLYLRITFLLIICNFKWRNCQPVPLGGSNAFILDLSQLSLLPVQLLLITVPIHIKYYLKKLAIIKMCDLKSWNTIVLYNKTSVHAHHVYNEMKTKNYGFSSFEFFGVILCTECLIRNHNNTLKPEQMMLEIREKVYSFTWNHSFKY